MRKPETYTAQGAENLGRANPQMPNPYAVGSTDWRAFEHGQAIAKSLADNSEGIEADENSRCNRKMNGGDGW